MTASGAPVPPAEEPAAIRPGESPPTLWRGVTALGITCLVHTARGVDTGARHRALCEAVRAHAARGAPIPVALQPLGGDALRPGTATLLVHATIEDVRGVPVMAIAVRPIRHGADDALLFAAAPRAVAADDAVALDAAVAAMLAGTLPWLARADGARPIG